MTHSPEYLLKMVRQIAANQPRDFDDAVNAERVASHLKRFWAPSMLEEAMAIPTEQLDPQTAQALELLKAAD